jgi:hypothetical protein
MKDKMVDTKQQHEILKEIILPHGMEVDISEAWKKLISSQFGGTPGRGFGELIQNFLDSYPASTPWTERRGEISTGDKEISLTDYGEGMDRKRLSLLLTLGGTDKMDDPTKIGTFGVGFFSIFNPKLSTKTVVVITRCEGHVVELTFVVNEPGERPEIMSRILDQDISFSTRIHVTFLDSFSPGKCLEYATSCLRYYPCRMIIDGSEFESVWDQAEKAGARMFKSGFCDGLIDMNTVGYRAIVLCKYECITDLTIPGIVTGGHNMTYDLRDYAKKEMACLPKERTIINCNNLNVTISRDSFKMDSAYDGMVEVLKSVMLQELHKLLKKNAVSRDIVLANQYIFADKLRKYLTGNVPKEKLDKKEAVEVYTMLLESQVYNLSGKKDFYSLRELSLMKSTDTPLFFSPRQSNLRWLGGAFKHDFIVLPWACRFKSGAPHFYDTLFQTVFGDVVNLDTIKEDTERLQDLVQRNIIPEELLKPDIKIAEKREFSDEERQLIEELTRLLALEKVQDVLFRQLRQKFHRVRVTFFEFLEQGAVVATGLFDEEGNILKEQSPGPAQQTDEENRQVKPQEEKTVMLGLNRSSDLIRSLLENTNSDRAFFMLPILANELAMSQKWLAPHTSFFHLTKEKIASGLRSALMDNLLPDFKAA